MPQTAEINRRIVLAERPKSLPDENTLRLEKAEVPRCGGTQAADPEFPKPFNSTSAERQREPQNGAKPRYR